jgi:succinyl-diaminopimelate desuccinylase
MASSEETKPGDSPGSAALDRDQQELVDRITQLVQVQTFRTTPFDAEHERVVQAGLDSIRRIFDARLAERLGEQSAGSVDRFEWLEPVEPQDRGRYRVFGYRVGTGPRKTTLMCHLDTVPPGSDDWDPFGCRVETRIYKGSPQPFIIGRGAIDDKGPAVVAFESFLTVAEEALSAARSSAPDPLAGVTLEVLFDTSEETDMSTPHYFAVHPDQIPELGVVFDAYWSVRAEKGIERPVFSIRPDAVAEAPDGTLSILELATPPGPTNMIPAWASASISGPTDQLRLFEAAVGSWYRACPFDDPEYQPADLKVSYHPAAGPGQRDTVELRTLVAGAQHGSAPNDNRRNGANPIVSLTCFLATLIGRGILANNANGEMTRFIQWAFGTRVFGENHPELLYRYDPVFTEGNGTTYALTQLGRDADGKVELSLDIRYAIGHHRQGWDGSEGTIPGKSQFKRVFGQLVKRYRTDAAGAQVNVRTQTVKDFGPDVRSPRNANLSRVAMAYRAVMGENCPMRATGGATDAHGLLPLVTAGSLFTTDFGPPVNYHGIDEGAPLVDLQNSAKILLHLLRQELGK